MKSKPRPTPKPKIDDLQFISNPSLWPHLILPLKRYRKGEHLADLALLDATLGPPHQFRLLEGANLWHLTEWTGTPRTITPAEVVAEGWKVD